MLTDHEITSGMSYDLKIAKCDVKYGNTISYYPSFANYFEDVVHDYVQKELVAMYRDTQPIIPRHESYDELRRRLEYVTGEKIPETACDQFLDDLAARYGLRRRRA